MCEMIHNITYIFTETTVKDKVRTKFISILKEKYNTGPRDVAKVLWTGEYVQKADNITEKSC